MQSRVELMSAFELIRVFDNWILFWVISLIPFYLLHFSSFAINDYFFLSQNVFENTDRFTQKYIKIIYFFIF